MEDGDVARCAACRCEVEPDWQFGLPPNRRMFCGACVDALVDFDKIAQRHAKRAVRRLLASLRRDK